MKGVFCVKSCSLIWSGVSGLQWRSSREQTEPAGETAGGTASATVWRKSFRLNLYMPDKLPVIGIVR